MSILNKQILDKMDKIQETLEAIRSDLSAIKEKPAVQFTPRTAANQTKPVEPVININLDSAWRNYPEQYKKLMGIAGSLSFDAWFGSVRNIEIREKTLYLKVDDKFMKEALAARYTGELKQVFEVESILIKSLEDDDVKKE